jgi:hypothetical protein
MGWYPVAMVRYPVAVVKYPVAVAQKGSKAVGPMSQICGM